MSTRRAFLAASAALAATPPSLATAAPPPKPAPSEPPIPKLNFDLNAFYAQLDQDVPHKHLFTATKFDYGYVLEAVSNTLSAYGDIGVQANQVASAAVLYHGSAILIAMDDYAWDTYARPVLPVWKQTEPDIYKDFQTVIKERPRGNPMLKDALPEGLHFYVCNNALKGFSRIIADAQKKDAANVYADLRAHMVPNATAVPAGVWAVHAIQERKYTLLQTL